LPQRLVFFSFKQVDFVLIFSKVVASLVYSYISVHLLVLLDSLGMVVTYLLCGFTSSLLHCNSMAMYCK